VAVSRVPPLGPSLASASSPVRSHATVFLPCVSLTTWSRLSGPPSSSPRRADFLPRSTDQIRRPYLSFLTWSTPELFIPSSRTPPLHLTPKQRTDVVPRRLRSSRSRSRPPSRAPQRLRADSVFGSYLGELAMFSTPSWCFSFAR
jgi:hypothetical protein